ncbi:MAG: hypothetical protein ACE5E7_03625 [Anaerolineae bacterium]
MFENYILVAVIVSILWLGSLGFYLYTSRQHKDLQGKIESVRELLDKPDHKAS